MRMVESATPATAGAWSIATETFDSLAGRQLHWAFPFVLPGWMRAWQEVFAPQAELWIRSFQEGGDIVGVAPLRVENRTARLIGDADVCDHLDLFAASGRRGEVCRALLRYLRAEGIAQLELNPLRPDSTVMTALVPAARAEGYAVSSREDDVLLEVQLPGSWDEYLRILSGKQRHEVRRKLRRLESSAAAGFRVLEDPATVRAAMDDFFVLFRQNREDKAAFLSDQMEAYFRLLAEYVPGMRIGFLDVDGMPAAAVLCCDHEGTRYLYNSGYDANLGHLSVGIVCKILSLRESISRGLKRFDFLKGNEIYKRQLGGSPVPIYRCRIELERTE
jgi:CelD/BcsL family acetyltransferase involved in cellulose biosynthesis